MVPEIWSATDILNQSQRIKILKKWKKTLEISFYNSVLYMTIVWCMAPEMWSATQNFGHCFPNSNPKNQNFAYMEKITGDIILHKCNKNHDHMLHCSWEMVHDGYNCYFSFWAIFCPLTPLTQKIIFLFFFFKKNPGDIIILHKCTKSHDHMLYCS